MQSDEIWEEKFWRFLANGIAGSLTTALISTLCLGVAGTLFGWLLSLVPANWNDTDWMQGTILGMAAGLPIGVFLGFLIFGIFSLKITNGDALMPYKLLVKRVSFGQAIGTLGACIFYVALNWITAYATRQSFFATVGDNAHLLLISAPASMICGAIAGALSKRDLSEVATLNAK